MTDDLGRSVVVGFDGSPSSSAALDAAAKEALVLGVPLRIVHAYVWPIFYATLANVPYRPGEWEPPAAVRAELDATAERLAGQHVGLAVRTSVMAGSGGPVLAAESVDAAMVVPGASQRRAEPAEVGSPSPISTQLPAWTTATGQWA